MSQALPSFLVLGKIVRSYGNKGGVKAALFCDIKRFLPLKTIWLGAGTTWKKYSLEKNEVRNQFWYLWFPEIHSIQDAEELRNLSIAVPEVSLGPLETNTYYHYKLEGLQVFNATHESLGRVMKVINHPSNDFLLVEGNGLRTIPLSNSIIESINLEKNEIRLKINFR